MINLNGKVMNLIKFRQHMFIILGITTGTLTVQIDKLVRAELIERMPSENDRRAIVVGLTAQGLSLHRQHNQLHLELVNELTQELNGEQPAQLIGCLEKMIRAF